MLLGWKDDIREAARRVGRNPRTSILAVATLALGIGSAAGVFTVAHTVLLAPPPYRDSGRIVEIAGRQGDDRDAGVSPADLADFKREGLFEAATLTTYGEFSWTGQSLPGFDGSEVLRGLLVSADYFRVLDRPMAAGRGFARGEDERPRNQVAVLSYPLWQRRFAGRSDVIGRTITLNGSTVTVVGVAARDFLSFENYDVSVWMPLDGAKWPRNNRAYSVARLAPGVTVESADLRLKAVSARLAAAYPATNRNYAAAVEPMFERVHRQVRAPVMALGIAVLCLLAIAAMNVASLLLARATTQSREMAIRAALGAGRARLYRMVLAESTILGLAAGVGGAMIGAWMVEGLKSMVPESLQVGWMFTVDARIFCSPPARGWRPESLPPSRVFHWQWAAFGRSRDGTGCYAAS
jgi:predicted permease